LGDSIKENEIGGACRTDGRDEKCLQYFGWKTEGRDYSEHLDVDGRIILEWILGKYVGNLWAGFIWLRIGISNGLL
jgi:hypothetical protein